MKKIKKKETLISLSIVLSIISFLVTILNILALHDIHNDYVSQKVLESSGVSTAQKLPAWSQCPLEWTALTVGSLILIVSLIFLIITLIKIKSSTAKKGEI